MHYLQHTLFASMRIPYGSLEDAIAGLYQQHRDADGSIPWFVVSGASEITEWDLMA